MGKVRIFYMVVAMQYKERILAIVALCCIGYICICMFGIFSCVLTVSSPYLFVFGDDRVRGTREQVMIQVELVRLSCGEGMIRGNFMFTSLLFYFET